MNKLIGVASIAVVLSACSGSGSQSGDIDDVDVSDGVDVSGDLSLGAASPIAAVTNVALPDAVDTNTLVIDRDFGFSTARTIDINFDIEDARTEDATVSICTDYKLEESEYDVNFDSCTVNGVLENGAFEHSMEVTIDKTAVVAAVFFQNSAIAPLFKEFSVNDSLRLRSKNHTQVIVWHQ